METDNIFPTSLFSRSVHAGRRTYYFDVKASKSSDDLFIIITERGGVGRKQGHQKQKLFLHKEDFEKFQNALSDAIAHVREESGGMVTSID